jgi:hypothetical protein
MSDTKQAEASHESTPAPVADSAIDPALADLPAPSRPDSASASVQPEESTDHTNNRDETNGSSSNVVEEGSTLYSFDEGHIPLGITASIAQAPNPRPSDFNYTQIIDPPSTSEGLDYDTIMNDDTPGSPTTKIMKAVVPHNAAQLEPKWPPVSLVKIHATSTSLSKIRLGGKGVVTVVAVPSFLDISSREWLSGPCECGSFADAFCSPLRMLVSTCSLVSASTGLLYAVGCG